MFCKSVKMEVNITVEQSRSIRKRGDLTEAEKEMLQAAAAGDVQSALQLLNSKEVCVNCLDENGMSPLMHAAYKGQADICRLLLQHGADVNCNEHEYGYTALMFASLSGNAEITSMMLDAGAETDPVNSVGRTAAQMAAFVGQHDCVTVINNFFSRTRLEYYTRPQGVEMEPILPPKLAGPLHKIIMTTNLNPVKMVMMVKEDPLLVDEVALEKCYRVMDLLCEQCVKQQDMNEVLALKMHYISYVLQKCLAYLQECDDKLDALLRSLLKGRDGDGFPEYQEKFIQDCIQTFPYCETTLLHQLGPVEIEKSSSAFSVLTQALTGQMAFSDAEFCATCGERGADKKCSFCEMVVYCGQACQELHWFTHKEVCNTLRGQRKLQNKNPSSLCKIVKHDDEHTAVEGNCTSLLGLCLGFAELECKQFFCENYPVPSDASSGAMSGFQD
ncbi:ankyrin repeat and MYND domain-containing protein 2-like [Trichomycterus rosablanca]|uniref:ankyrin repeat and MYND domain-containing protein 2-like n=1 Tax=Trichomycterus rosablanca TaxID=2290929 RepID=UPI002F353082